MRLDTLYGKAPDGGLQPPRVPLKGRLQPRGMHEEELQCPGLLHVTSNAPAPNDDVAQIFLNDRSLPRDRFNPKMVQIGAILAIFQPIEVPG